MRPVGQTGELPGQIPRYPPVQRRPVHTPTSGYLHHLAPSRTARTASRRCSTTDKTTSANPGLPSPDVPRKTSHPGWPKHATVADHMAEECRTSVAGGQCPLRNPCENFLYGFKAARRAARAAATARTPTLPLRLRQRRAAGAKSVDAGRLGV